jgi:hypothetical protein
MTDDGGQKSEERRVSGFGFQVSGVRIQIAEDRGFKKENV